MMLFSSIYIAKLSKKDKLSQMTMRFCIEFIPNCSLEKLFMHFTNALQDI